MDLLWCGPSPGVIVLCVLSPRVVPCLQRMEHESTGCTSRWTYMCWFGVDDGCSAGAVLVPDRSLDGGSCLVSPVSLTSFG